MQYYKNMAVDVAEEKEKEKIKLSTDLKEYYEQKLNHFIELCEIKSK